MGGASSAWREGRPRMVGNYMAGEQGDLRAFLGNQTHSDHFKLLRQDGSSLLIGARNVVYNISLSDLTENTDLRITWNSRDRDRELCLVKGKSQDDCNNYVRVLAKVSEEKRRFLEQQDMQRRQHPQQQQRSPGYSQPRSHDPRVSRQIPVVYEGEGPYSRHPQQHDPMNTRPHSEDRHQSDHGYSRPSHQDNFFSEHSRSPMFERAARGNSRRSQLPEDPFSSFGKSPFFNDPLFGW